MDRKQKLSRYGRVRGQLAELLEKTPDPQARMATVAALLFHKFDHYFWCGFYRLVNGDLVVGPYQGPLACQVLARGQGVCWEAVKREGTVIVPDVHNFPGHIACDSRSRSEIVVPVRNRAGAIVAVLDADSDRLAQFDEADAEGLQGIVDLLLQ
ncbi:MAG: GAF domain-containing protein [Acidobacteria bacterium]|jgi:GAF domain-containing protein|nr:GAF domain-containing protein [Acidobacteriota bacterium]